MKDLYHEIYQGQIFQSSQCIWHENTILDFLRSNLIDLGYKSTDLSNKVWQRGNRNVVVCLVDDFTTCDQTYAKNLSTMFDRDTVVITDNYVNVPTQYPVLRLPDSFLGIYSHDPGTVDWQPERRFCFSVNRLDNKRMLLFLELQMRCNLDPSLDYVNFNCWSWSGDNTSKQGLQQNFSDQWTLLESTYHDVYHDTYAALQNHVPYKNHDITVETAHTKAWLNMVVETYSSDNVIAVSEKIFRCLTLPVPWMVYSGRFSVARLRQLGFDVLDDVVDHEYDGMIENRTAAYGDKLVDWIYQGSETVNRMKSLDRTWLDQRLRHSALHNQQLLLTMRRRWPADFAQWWAQNMNVIA